MPSNKKFRPYVRRANGKEKPHKGDWRMAIRLAYYQQRLIDTGKPYFVLVQHGFRCLAMEVGPNKREVQKTPIAVSFGKKKFKAWARSVGRKAKV